MCLQAGVEASASTSRTAELRDDAFAAWRDLAVARRTDPHSVANVRARLRGRGISSELAFHHRMLRARALLGWALPLLRGREHWRRALLRGTLGALKDAVVGRLEEAREWQAAWLQGPRLRAALAAWQGAAVDRRARRQHDALAMAFAIRWGWPLRCDVAWGEAMPPHLCAHTL